MISIITPRNRHLYARELDAMFELRHRVVIREWGWRIPGATDGRESDAFDGDDTVYIVAFGADHRKVVGCARLNPTTGPHLFSELFADYCGLQGVRRGERIFELSRFLVDPSLSRRDYGRVMGSMEFAVNTFCLASHITHLTWLSHGAIYQHSL
ncbi:MAG TPA: acyl-homoserine-lactone synthase, partial [Parvularculaceae bacterium]|nr:acyl-homoserine-lactone synthase [Parvularculaceae bacterium]